MIMGVTIEKSTTWRGEEEFFSNVYHYNTAVGQSAESVINALVTIEKPYFGSVVAFKRGRAFGPTDQGKAANVMLFEKPLTGLGTSQSTVSCPREMTILVSWDTGRKNTRGKPIYLRKYLHVGNIGSQAGQEAANGNVALPQGEIDKHVNYGNQVKNIETIGGQMANLTDRLGRGLPLATPTAVNQFMRIRQFRG